MITSKIFLLNSLLLVTLSTQLNAQDSQAARDQAKSIQGQAVDAFNNGKYGESEELFNKSLSLDPSSSEANEYLKKIEAQKKERTGSREKAKKFESQIEDQSELDKLKKGVSTDSISLDGKLKKEKGPNSDDSNQVDAVLLGDSDRPLQFKLPRMYDRLGFPALSASQLDSSRFMTKAEAYKKVPYWPDKFSEYGSGAVFFKYDSNIADITTDTYSNSDGVTKRSSAVMNAMFNMGTRSTPLKRFEYGADFRNLYRRFGSGEFSTHDTISTIPSVWASWWNTRSTEVNFRYDFGFTARSRTNLSYHNVSHGPQLSVSQLLAQFYQLDFAYSLQRNTYSGDVVSNARDFSGLAHDLSLKAAYLGLSWFRPFLKYTWDRNRTSRDDFISISNAVEGGASVVLGPSSRFNLSAEYQYTTFSSDLNQRHDNLVRFHAASFFALGSSFSVLFDGMHIKNASSQTDTNTYYRLEGLLGIMYTFL